MRSITIIFLVFIFPFALFAQKHTDRRIEPLNWWTGMKNEKLQLMIYDEGISKYSKVDVNSAYIHIKGVRSVESPNYLFIDIEIDRKLEAGIYSFKLSNIYPFEIYYFEYEFKNRRAFSADRQSFNSSDVIYLLMPDRFANGDVRNDSVEEAIEKANRDRKDGRHGGDIQGIIDRLDYLADLGVTALWSTPLLFDNEPRTSYHTYAISDYYKVDPRYGNNQDYKRLAAACHKRGIKLIMDMVTNHCGISHWWMKDLPQSDWVHQFPAFTRTNYRMSAWNDPYAAKSDFDLNKDGWFDHSMPDLNQNNALLLTYFIQNAIWWIEYANLDGLRVDTYPYNDKWEIAKWSKAILEEYPALNIVGECWQHRPAEIAYWQRGVDNYDDYDSYLPSVMDFCLTDQLAVAFNEEVQGWDKGVARFYNSLLTDYLYADPYSLLIFCDNHDITRFSESVDYSIDKYKLAFTFLFTTRGIPQIYYGSEIMLDGSKSNGDGDIRKDFPGGWPTDTRDAFTENGRTAQENEVFNHFRTLLNWRKNNPVIHSGKLTHFVPEDNVYVYFRYDDYKNVMVILNNNKDSYTLNTHRFHSSMGGSLAGTDIISGVNFTDLSNIKLAGKTGMVIELSNKE